MFRERKGPKVFRLRRAFASGGACGGPLNRHRRPPLDTHTCRLQGGVLDPCCRYGLHARLDQRRLQDSPSECVPCDGSTYQSSPNATLCMPCEPGSICPLGASAPLPCLKGTVERGLRETVTYRNALGFFS